MLERQPATVLTSNATVPVAVLVNHLGATPVSESGKYVMIRTSYIPPIRKHLNNVLALQATLLAKAVRIK